ncbi:MAG: single-stranded-DNA-specific exonuclease RecJ, partial [Clostridiales bacterium]|nr:single-stranded-DNA-specific exonuclease RecJ [Clostridiales bacterium]
MIQFKKRKEIENLPCIDESLPLWQNQLLLMRGMDTLEKKEAFLHPSLDQLHDPFLLEDMDRAVEHIFQVIEKKEPMVIYGDYDVDGMCATTLLLEGLENLGAKVDYYIPSRHTEGYGLNKEAVEALSKKAKLMITVDCGITAHQEVMLAKNLGMEVIVTDHHQLPEEKVPALAVLNPLMGAYPFEKLCGTGVAAKLLQALGGEKALLPCLDLVALATVADLVPLTGENRILVFEGLKELKNTKRIGLKQLIHLAGIDLQKEIRASQVAFMIAPRLNAAGRLSSGEKGVKLLYTKSEKEGLMLANQLHEENEERQEIEKELLQKAITQVENTIDLSQRRSLVVRGENWNTGVIGLVASRLAEKYYYPTVVLSRQENEWVGSVRSIAGVNIYRVLKDCAFLFTRFGGHEQAAGLTLPLENVETFIRVFDEKTKELSDPEAFIPIKEYDLPLPLSEVTEKTVHALSAMQPTGYGNPEPVFLLEEAHVEQLQQMGKNKEHLRLLLRQDHTLIQGVAFRMGEMAPELTTKVEALFVPEINTYGGKKNIQC